MTVARLAAILSVVVIVLLPVNSSGAQPSRFDWQPRPMQSGEIANIVFSPSNPEILYLGVEVNAHSFYKSKDGGKAWFKIDSGDHTKDVAVHPTNPEVAFYADSQNLWRTETGGQRLFTKSNCDHRREKCATAFDKVLFNDNPPGPSETSFSSIAMAPSDPNIVYASVKGGFAGPFGGSKGGTLYQSTDGGKTFTKLTGSYPSILVVIVDPGDSQKLWIGSESGVYLSTDGGQSMREVKRVRGVTGIDTIDGQSIIAASEEGIVRSTNSGSIWEVITDGLPSKTVLRVDIALSNPNIVWATTAGGVAKSTDAGQTWTDVSNNLPSKNLQALAVQPKNPDLALVATETFVFSVRSTGFFREGQYSAQGLYRTEDGGKTWTRSDAGLIENWLEELTAHPTRPFEVWAGQQSSRGMYRSRDAGQTWSLTPHLLTHYPMRLVFHPTEPETVFHTSLHIGEDFGISRDSGVSWSITSEDTFYQSIRGAKNLFNQSLADRGNLHLHGLAVDPKNPQVIYVGSVDDPSPFNEKPLKGSHIFKSTDGAKTWIESDGGYDHEKATSIHDIKIDPTDSNIVYVATTEHEATVGNGIWQSLNSGQTWQRLNKGMADDTSVSVILIHPKNPTQLLVGGGSGIHRSTDRGESWQFIQRGRVADMEFDPTNPDVVYAGGGDGLLMSTNFGESWTDISNNLPRSSVNAVAVNSTGTIVYAGVDNYGIYLAIDPSVGEIKKDQTVGAKYGKGKGFGGDQRLFTRSLGRDKEPLYVKLIVMSVGGAAVAAIILAAVLIIKRRQRDRTL